MQLSVVWLWLYVYSRRMHSASLHLQDNPSLSSLVRIDSPSNFPTGQIIKPENFYDIYPPITGTLLHFNQPGQILGCLFPNDKQIIKIQSPGIFP